MNRNEIAQDNSTLALQYGREGIPVVPLYGVKDDHCRCGDAHCNRVGMHPRTKNGVSEATTDPDQIEQMWLKWPKAEIGIVVGRPAKFVAVEACGKAGRHGLRALIAANEPLPRTVRFRDNDRRLLLYGMDEPASRDIADGVRILGNGELIVAPSKIDQLAGKRRYARKRAPGQVKLAAAPDWLIAVGRVAPVAAKGSKEPRAQIVKTGSATPPLTTETSEELGQTVVDASVSEGPLVQRKRRGRPRKVLAVDCRPPNLDASVTRVGDIPIPSAAVAGTDLTSGAQLVFDTLRAFYLSVPPAVQALMRELLRA